MWISAQRARLFRMGLINDFDFYESLQQKNERYAEKIKLLLFLRQYIKSEYDANSQTSIK